MINAGVQIRILNGFEDTVLTPDSWNDLLQGPGDVIFMTWHWQKVWWEVFGKGKLLLMMAEQDGKPIAIAPLYADEGMIFFTGSGGSDYLDFIGDLSDPNILEAMLVSAIERVPGFVGFRFYHVLEDSPTPNKLAEIAHRHGWYYCNEGELESPMLSIKDFPEQAHQSIRKKSLLRHESWFIRNGGIKVEHFSTSEDILPHLDLFFEQHIARWKETPFPSLFLDPIKRLFYQRFSETASETGLLRFTRVSWRQRSIAFHFGFNYKGSFFWYKPSFDISLAKNSPGEVLLRQLLIRALEEHAHTFDFGLGDEPFKKRFTTNSRLVRTWGVYPT